VIFGKVGRIGHGKTMRAVVDAIELARQSDPCAVLVANLKVNVPPGVPFVQLPMDGFGDYLSEVVDEARALGRGVVCLVDEIDTIWDAQSWREMTKVDRFRIKQSRKVGLDIIWTAQFVDQVEKSLRNITEEVELVRAFPPPTLQRRRRGKRPWLIVGQRFRPGALRELAANIDPDKRLGRVVHRYRRADELLYDTDELIRPPGQLRVPSRTWLDGAELVPLAQEAVKGSRGAPRVGLSIPFTSGPTTPA